jgi:hypothetical protein
MYRSQLIVAKLNMKPAAQALAQVASSSDYLTIVGPRHAVTTNSMYYDVYEGEAYESRLLRTLRISDHPQCGGEAIDVTNATYMEALQIARTGTCPRWDAELAEEAEREARERAEVATWVATLYANGLSESARKARPQDTCRVASIAKKAGLTTRQVIAARRMMIEQGDVTGLTGDVTRFIDDVAGLQRRVTGLTGDVTGLTGDVSPRLTGDVAQYVSDES